MDKKTKSRRFAGWIKNYQFVPNNVTEYNRFYYDHDGEPVVVNIQVLSDFTLKDKMYAYLYKVILPIFAKCLRDDGYPEADTVFADYMLKCELSKDWMRKNDGTYVPYVRDKRDMTRSELWDYINRAVYWIMFEYNIQVPDSQEYKEIKTEHEKKIQKKS